MSRKSSPHSPWSWLDAVAELFGTPTRKAFRQGRGRGQRRTLRLEPLESRNLLSVSVPAAISGVAYYDATGSGLTASSQRLSGVTVQLWLNGGSGLINGLPGGNDTLQATTTTNANGNYQFTDLAIGTYYVEQLPAPGYVLGTGQGVATVNITSSALTGTAGLVIDSFSATTQTASTAYPSGAGGTSYSTATEAIGGARDMTVQLTSAHGAVSLGANSTTPDALDFTTGPGAVGTGQVVWQGQAFGEYAVGPGELRNPSGLNGIDLTSAGASTGIELTVGGDHTGTAVLTIYTDAGDWSSATFTIPNTNDGTATQQVFVPFSSFTVGSGSGATFSNVGAIELTVTGPAAMDAQVGTIDAVGPTVFTENFANSAQTDLAIVKAAAPSPVVAGTQLTYTFTSTNNGPSSATGVTVTDTLPAGETFVSATTSQGTTSFANDTLTVTLGNMASGGTATTTVLVDVASSVTGTLTNTATISGNQPDPNLTNNTSTVTTPVTQEADLAIVKSGSPDPVDAGKPLTYTLTATNNGPSDDTGVTVVDTLPAGVTYASSTSTQGSTSDAGATVTANLGNLASGATATITIVVNVASTTTGTITNTATISGNQPDPNLANNTGTCLTDVSQPIIINQVPTVDLAIVKSYSPATVYAGDTFTYTLSIINNGPQGTVGDVTVTDPLPSGVTFVSATASKGSPTFSNGIVTDDLGTMAYEATATVTIIVRDTAPSGTTLTNTGTVSVTSLDDDTDPANNQSTVQTLINSLPSKRQFLGR